MTGDPHGSHGRRGPRDSRGPGVILRLLLLLYPAAFRRRYGEEMAELFRWRLERASRGGGRGADVRAWLRLVADVAVGGMKERVGGRRGLPGPGAVAGERRKVDFGGGEGVMTRMLHDLREAARRLIRTPFFTLGAVAIVALGIGANTAVFTVVDAMLLRPFPYDDPDRVVAIYQDSDDGQPSASSFPAYRDMAAFTDVFSGVAATSGSSLTWETDDAPRRARIEYVTSSYLPVLGLEPSHGRWFDASHDRVGAGTYAVVSHHTWRHAMGSDPDVVGRAIRMDGQPVTIIGVGPEGFNGSGGAVVTDFWLSISSAVLGGPFRVQNLERRQDHWYDVRARLAPGVSVAQARSAMDALAARLAEEYPELNRGRDITVFEPGEVRVHPDADGQLQATGGFLMAVVLLVLLLACSNLANLLLVRGIARAPEVAMRRALGAGRARVAGLFLAEALLLSAAGGVVGVALAGWALQVVPALAVFPAGTVLDLALDHRVLLFTMGLVLVTGIAFGLAPGLRSARSDVAGALREGGRSASPGRAAGLVRRGLVAVQVAVSLVLLVAAGLATRSLVRTQRVDPGVDAGRVAYLGTTLDRELAAEEVALTMTGLRERIEALPGVTAAGFTTRRPVEGGSSTTTVMEGYDPPSGTGAVELPLAFVDAGYFETMGIPLVAGRGFTDRDTPGSATVVLISETAARRYWGDAHAAVGRRVRPQSQADGWREVVGVVGDVKVSSLQEADRPMLYLSADQFISRSGFLVARTAGDPAALVTPLRQALEEVAPGAALDALGTMDDHFGGALALPRFAMTFLGGFSALAVALACLGIYAVVSFTVLRRTGEMGIRMALGAGRGRVVRMVVGEVLGVVGLGVLAGLAVAALVAPRVEGALFQVSGLDPLALGSAVLLLVAASGLASWLPARRAALTDPVEALRAR